MPMSTLSAVTDLHHYRAEDSERCVNDFVIKIGTEVFPVVIKAGGGTFHLVYDDGAGSTLTTGPLPWNISLPELRDLIKVLGAIVERPILSEGHPMNDEEYEEIFLRWLTTTGFHFPELERRASEAIADANFPNAEKAKLLDEIRQVDPDFFVTERMP